MALIPLRAGPLEMVFDDTTAFLRHVRFDGREIVRGIFAAVRDRNWDTVAATVNSFNIQRSDCCFEISFQVAVQADGIDFRWHGTVTGAEAGTVTFDFDGIAQKPFLKNRIGLCVLHPIQPCAGQPCRIIHTDGSVTTGVFPKAISPHQPFKNIRSISHKVTPDVSAELLLEGDVFEMEDQRNWTDASYKIYSTPLELPFPVSVEAGQRFRQTAILQLDKPPSQRKKVCTTRLDPNVVVNWREPRRPPPIGLGMATTGRKLSAAAVELLATTAPAHLRVDLSLAADDWPARLREAAELAAAVKANLHVALFLSDAAEHELESLIPQLANQRPEIGLWMIFHVAHKTTPAKWLALARRKLSAWDPAIPFAAGTNAYFAELNRERPHSESMALPCYSVNPQVHAFDNLSLVETLGAQRSTVETAGQFSTHPVVISPITLCPRFNPNATENIAQAAPGTDPRQSTGFAAAWTAGSLARLASDSGIHSLTYYETAGPRGILGDDGQPFPLYYVFKSLAGCDYVYACCCDQPLHIAAIGLSHGDDRRMLLASFSVEPQTVLLRGVDGNVRVRPLSATGFATGAVTRAAGGLLEVNLPGENVVLVELESVASESVDFYPPQPAP